MARLYLHIGWPKTGSTALQNFCAANRDLLARHGLSYYASRGNCCGTVARAIANAAEIAPMRADFRDWLGGQAGRDVLISAEGFAGLDPAAVLSVFAAGDWDRVEVIAYLRRQEAFLEGWYKQIVKWGGKQALTDFLRPGAPAWVMGDYRAALENWAAYCDRDDRRMHLRIHPPSILAGADLGADFFAAIGFPDLPATVGVANVSPSAALIGLYLRLPPIDRLQQINRAMVASGHPAATGSGDLFDAGTIARIRAHYAAVNEAIRRQYFPDSPGLFPAPENASPENTISEAARPAPDPAGLDQLLIDTLARMRGPEVAQAASRALAS